MMAATRPTMARLGSEAARLAARDGVDGREQGALAGRCRHAQGCRDLLQEDDDGDADREALDDGPRDVGQVAAQPEQRGAKHEHARR